MTDSGVTAGRNAAREQLAHLLDHWDNGADATGPSLGNYALADEILELTAPADVARVYTEASNRSRTPLKIVAETFGISQSTATRRVAEARRAGLIPETAGTTNPYLPAIAADLGVTVEQLEDAIRKHAPNGNLRVKV